MSFSSDVKGELSRVKLENRCCNYAELAAFARVNGNLSIFGGGVNLEFTTEHAAIARRIFTLIKNLYDSEVELSVRKNKQLKKNNNYSIKLLDKAVIDEFLKDINLLNDSNTYFNLDYSVPWNFLDERCCRRAYIRGAFLGSGSISDPNKSYHMEFVSNKEIHAKGLVKLINDFGINSKKMQRKDSFIVYIKDGGQISDVLNIMSAHNNLLEFESVRALKDFKNNINRQINCETANINKVVNAGVRQERAILMIQKKRGLKILSDDLRELAELRLDNVQASLKELGEMLNPPISKAAVNGKLRRIEAIAKTLYPFDKL